MTSGFFCGRRWLPEDIPDAGQGECCIEAALDGPRACTCWVEVYSEPQQPIRPGEPPVPDPPVPCQPGPRDGGCAYLAGSPERTGKPGWEYASAEDLDHLAGTGQRFYCHAGCVYLIGYAHPSGASYSPELGDFRPPKRDGVPYRADGTPAMVCGGWMLRRSVLLRQAGKEAGG